MRKHDKLKPRNVRRDKLRHASSLRLISFANRRTPPRISLNMLYRDPLSLSLRSSENKEQLDTSI